MNPATQQAAARSRTSSAFLLRALFIGLLTFSLKMIGPARLALIAGNIKNALHPEHYHGHNVPSSFFEGWYFKSVDPLTNTSVIFIPGIFRARGTDDAARVDDHAFIMVFGDSFPEALYYRFGASEFADERDLAGGNLRIRVGTNNFFRHDGLTVDLDARRLVDVKDSEFGEYVAGAVNDIARIVAGQPSLPDDERADLLDLLHGTAAADKPVTHLRQRSGSKYAARRAISVTADLRFEELNPLPRTLYAPGVMGPLSYVPFLECNHGVVSMFHGVAGKVEFWESDERADGKAVEKFEIEKGQGYIEKDWGMYFPQSWIWIQSNTFVKSPGTGLMISIADVPFLDPDWPLVTFLTTKFPFLKSYLRMSGRLITLHLNNGSILDPSTADKPGSNKSTLLNFSSYTFAKVHRLDIDVHNNQEEAATADAAHGDATSSSSDRTATTLPLTQHIRLVVSDSHEQLFLSVTAKRRVGRGVPLRAPDKMGQRMQLKVEESLDALIVAKLWRKVEGKDERIEILWEDTGVAAGLEIVGDVAWFRDRKQ